MLKATLGTLTIITGGLVYVIFRTKRLIMFSLFAKLRLSTSVEYLRNTYGNLPLYAWVKYNLPAALWLFSYLFIMDSIWSNHPNRALYWTFMSIIPVLAFCSEILQYHSLIPGTFDLMDLGSYICALILFFTINQFLK
jgi:hypothetical protein